MKRGTIKSMSAMTQTIFISSTSDSSPYGPARFFLALAWPSSSRHPFIALAADINASLFDSIYELILFAYRSSITTKGIGISIYNRIGKKLKLL